MGYYTDYEMVPNRYRCECRFETYQAIEAFIEATKAAEGWSDLFDVWRGEGAGFTWYNHRQDMVKLSAAFPKILFTLWGGGDETDDLWKEYYLNGECQVVQATITYPDCELDPTCPACYGAGVLHADGLPTTGCPKCWGTGEIH